jgi:hypothetical protein
LIQAIYDWRTEIVISGQKERPMRVLPSVALVLACFSAYANAANAAAPTQVAASIHKHGKLATEIATPVDFNRDIRTLLSNHCFRCHGPDEEDRHGGLRLDTNAGALTESDSGFAIVPGKPDESLLIERITAEDPELRMPPPRRCYCPRSQANRNAGALDRGRGAVATALVA